MRSRLALLTRSKAALAVMVAAVVVAVGATTVGYAAMNKTVTLSLDGRTTQVSTLGSTVGDVLDKEGVEVGDHDVVAPGPDARISDGSRIAVRFGRPLDVSVDGKDSRYWVTATDVASALDQLGLRIGGAALSTSRSASIGRDGLDLAIVTPKSIALKVGDKAPAKKDVPALTVAQALKNLGVRLGKDDVVKPGLGATLEDGDKIVVTRVRTVTRKVTEAIGHGTVKKADSGMYDDQSRVVRTGRDGSRVVTYRITFENGDVVARKVLASTVDQRPIDAIIRVGTKDRPAPAASPANFAGGSTVWDQLARCESGGNWAINTGNGYYGGLQFNLSTWQAYGGSGLPSDNSRETQIAIATKVRDANGGYGSWPACSQSLGLPQ